MYIGSFTNFKRIHIDYKAVKLGEVELVSIVNEFEKKSLSKKPQNVGLSLIDDRKAQLIEHMKNLVVEKNTSFQGRNR